MRCTSSFPVAILLISVACLSCMTVRNPGPVSVQNTYKTAEWNEIPETTLKAMLKASPRSLNEARNYLLSVKPSVQVEESLYVTEYLMYYLYPDILSGRSTEPQRGPNLSRSMYPLIFNAVRVGLLHEIPKKDMNVVTMLCSTLVLFAARENSVISRAVDLLAQFETVAPFSVLPPLLKGMMAERAGRFETAYEYYDESIRRGETCYPAVIGKARLAFRKKNHSEVIDLLLSIAPPPEKNYEYQALLAQSFFQKGFYEIAEAYADKSLSLNPKQSDLLLIKAEIEASGGRWDEALNFLISSEQISPVPEDKNFLKARIISKKPEKRQEAAALIERSGEFTRGDTQALELYGRLLIDDGKKEAGLNVLESIAARNPENKDVILFLFRLHIKDGEFRRAVVYADRVMRLDTSFETKFSLYQAYRGTGDQAKALTILKSLYETNPDKEAVVLEYVIILYEQKLNKECAAVIEKALGARFSRKANAELYYTRSLLQVSSELKLLDLRRALLEDPFNVKAVTGISRYYFTIKEYRKAYLFMKQAVALNPKDENLRLELEKMKILSGL